MDIAGFDALYPTPGHAAAADRRGRATERERLGENAGEIDPDRIGRRQYLARSRERSLEALGRTTEETRRTYILETIAIVDRLIADLPASNGPDRASEARVEVLMAKQASSTLRMT